MNATAYQKASSTLERSEADLRWLLATTEETVNKLVSSFQAMAGRIDSILRAASRMIAQVEEESIDSVRAGVDGLGVAARQIVKQRMQAINGILQTVTGEGELLRKLSMITDGQAKIALTIKALTVHTKIEIGHLGAVGLGFDYLAHELDDFSKSLAQSTERLTGRTESRWAENERARSILCNELPHLYEDMAQMEDHLRKDVEILNAGLYQLACLPPQFRASAEGIARDIATVVVAFQSQDITRQQMEHVRDALKLIADVSSSYDGVSSEELEDVRHAYAGILIQTHQLRSIEVTIVSWMTSVRECTASIYAISGADLASIGPLVLEQERMMSAQLSDIERIEQESMVCSGSIDRTLSGISGLSELVREELKSSESARSRLRMLTFNSVIEASSLGARADTICVIADGISEVSTEWSRIAQQSGDALQQILVLAETASAGMKTFSASGDARFSLTREAATNALAQLRAIASFAAVESETITSLARVMCAESKAISETCDLLDGCFQRISSIETDLEGLRREIESNHPGIAQAFDAERAERQFSAAYTTQSERDVLRAALYGTILVNSETSSAGNDVELF
ncbi:MAG: hypothetical protein WBY53_00865 [Acidobacteriaceae bacterium]